MTSGHRAPALYQLSYPPSKASAFVEMVNLSVFRFRFIRRPKDSQQSQNRKQDPLFIRILFCRQV